MDCQNLSFDLVDDISLACEAGTLSVDQIPKSSVSHLGPFLELHHFTSGENKSVFYSNWLQQGKFSELIQSIEKQIPWNDTLGAMGVAPIQLLASDDLAWPKLIDQVKKCAKKSGFSSDYGAQFASAIGEIFSNVIEHSRRAESGYIAYSANEKQFEFVIADRGIGVLDSLRQNQQFESLSDSGTALELALSEGISRHYETGRGMGFRPLFIGLANKSELIRFRSGNYARVLHKLHDGKILAKTIQLAKTNGLFCSVLCKP